ncbi:MAG: acyl dehydratase, partial [Sphingobium sp.]
GGTLRGTSEVIETKALRSRPEMGIVKNRVTIFNQHDEPVLTMNPIAMWRTRAG